MQRARDEREARILKEEKDRKLKLEEEREARDRDLKDKERRERIEREEKTARDSMAAKEK